MYKPNNNAVFEPPRSEIVKLRFTVYKTTDSTVASVKLIVFGCFNKRRCPHLNYNNKLDKLFKCVCSVLVHICQQTCTTRRIYCANSGCLFIYEIRNITVFALTWRNGI